MAQATAAPGSAHSAVAKENKKAIQARNLRTGLLFTAPALIVLAIFVFYPAIKTFITSLTSDRINRAGKFVGFDNYVKLFQSADFWTDVKNTLVYAVAYAPIVVIVALAFALLLNRKDLKFVGFFRTCMFLPFVISLTVAVAAVVLSVLNSFALGIGRVKGNTWIVLAIMLANMMPQEALLYPLYTMFKQVGLYNTKLAIIIIFTIIQSAYGTYLLSSVYGTFPQAILEAAAIDGASPWRRFRTIIFPLLSPTSFFLLVVNTIYTLFETFGIVHAVTQGGPSKATETLIYKVFNDGFIGLDFGGSSAQSVVLMLIVMVLTFLQFRYVERKVTY